MDDTPRPIEPRPLNVEEQSILTRLLEFAFPGAEALRVQIPFVSVVGVCRCGCVTRELTVDRDRVSPAVGVRSPIPAEAEIHPQGNTNGGGIIVFAKDGYLSSLEAYSHDVEPIREWPAMEALTFSTRA